MHPQLCTLVMGKCRNSSIQVGLKVRRQGTWHQAYTKRQRGRTNRCPKLFERTVGSSFVLHAGVEVREFVSLWQAIINMQDLNDLDDTIYWKWKNDGQYTPQVVLTKFSLQ